MIPQPTLLELLHSAWDRYGDKPAFHCLGRSLAYRELDELSAALCAYLQHRTGLQPGDRVAIQLPNLLQYPVAVYAALRAGLVIVNTNPLYTPRELQHQYHDAGVKAVITLEGLEEQARTALPGHSTELVITTAPTDLHTPLECMDANNHIPGPVRPLRQVLAAGRQLEPIPFAPAPDDLALLQYTGGTTGVAKGAMLSHRNLAANVAQITEHAAESFLEGQEIYVAPLPLYHIYAFNLNCLALPSRGGASILVPNPRDIDAFIEAIRLHPFTGFVGINTLFTALCRHPGFRQLDFSHLRSTAAGGMALGECVARQWQSLTGVEVGEGYGMTETAPVIASNPRPGIQPGTVGKPVPQTEVKVIDSDGLALAHGESGELCVRGPQVMQGYWQRPEATAEVLDSEGWLRTGDVAIIQPDGYIRIVDRLKDVIVVSGFNVYPHEVEEVASAYPGVLECAAISVASDTSGEAVKLYLVAQDAQLDTEDLRRYLRQHLAAYKVPTQYELRLELPKSNVGKILRRELR
ncbi:AMP-binding protein [Haliea sp. E17]|uniref:AMP-binding protein n=1 Tax=Haliea sp. E17 TaxID=3401576 RepID=UPI003AB0B649